MTDGTRIPAILPDPWMVKALAQLMVQAGGQALSKQQFAAVRDLVNMVAGEMHLAAQQTIRTAALASKTEGLRPHLVITFGPHEVVIVNAWLDPTQVHDPAAMALGALMQGRPTPADLTPPVAIVPRPPAPAKRRGRPPGRKAKPAVPAAPEPTVQP